VSLEQLEQVRGPGALDPLDPGEDGGRVAGLEVQLGRRDHGPHGGAVEHLRGHVPVQRLQGDQDRGLGVLQQLGKLALLVHRVDGDGDPARLPGPDLGDHELRHVLREDRDPLARSEALGGDPRGERVGQGVELGEADAAVEVADRVRVARPGDGCAEHVERGVVLRGE
jgi:hypothetical protein